MDMDIVYHMIFSLILAAALAGLALWRKALTPGGLTLAGGLAFVITFCGGLTGYLALAATFLLTTGAGRLSRRVREPIETKLHAKTGRRDAAQIFCNVFTGAVLLLLRTVTEERCFLWAFPGAMAASLADSLASELGVLSRRRPRDILTLRPAEKGLSGAVSPLGLGASLLGAAAIAALCAIGWGWGYGTRMFFGVTAAGFIAALLDSVLGSAAQAKYRCGVCGALTEKKQHCGADTVLERGARFVTNDVVNFCNNLAGAGIASILYLCMEKAP